MIKKYAEITCDYCNCGCHYPIGIGFSIKKQMKEDGWIITKDNQHFDSTECYKKYLLR